MIRHRKSGMAVEILQVVENRLYCETEAGGRLLIDDLDELEAGGGKKEIARAIEDAQTKNDLPEVVNAHPIKSHNDFRDKDIHDLKLFQDLDINLSSNDKRNVVVIQNQQVNIDNLYQVCQQEINKVGMNVFWDRLKKKAIKYKGDK